MMSSSHHQPLAGGRGAALYVRTGTRGTRDYVSAEPQLASNFSQVERHGIGPETPLHLFVDFGDRGFDVESFREVARFLEARPQDPARGCSVHIDTDATPADAREVALTTLRLGRAGWAVNPEA